VDEKKCRNISLDKEQRREVLSLLLKRYGSIRRLAEALGVSKSSLHRIIRGEQTGSLVHLVDYRVCLLLDEEEFLAVLKRRQVLEAIGLVKDGRVNIPLLVAVLDAALDYEEAKHAVLELVAKRFKAELREILGETFPKIELKWTPEFEKWLTEKKSKPISKRTLRDYRNLWYRCLEGKVLGWHLLKQLSGKQMLCHDNQYHPTGWTRQIFRHYIRWLYSIGKLDWDTYTWLLLVVPGRRYGRRVSQKVIREEDVINTLKVLSEKGREDILTLYLLMLASGTRFIHSLEVLNNWREDEEFYVAYLNRIVKRLECFNEHCRYYLGKEHEVKPAGFMYFPRTLLPLVRRFASKLPNRRRIEKVVRKWRCLPPKYIRIYALRLMKQVIGDNDVYRFIVGKFGELTVSARHYMDLLKEADEVYPKYIQRWSQIFDKAIRLDIELRRCYRLENDGGL